MTHIHARRCVWVCGCGWGGGSGLLHACEYARMQRTAEWAITRAQCPAWLEQQSQLAAGPT